MQAFSLFKWPVRVPLLVLVGRVYTASVRMVSVNYNERMLSLERLSFIGYCV